MKKLYAFEEFLYLELPHWVWPVNYTNKSQSNFITRGQNEPQTRRRVLPRVFSQDVRFQKQSINSKLHFLFHLKQKFFNAPKNSEQEMYGAMFKWYENITNY